VDELASHSLIAPCCGLGSTTVANADLAFQVLARTGEILQQGS